VGVSYWLWCHPYSRYLIAPPGSRPAKVSNSYTAFTGEEKLSESAIVRIYSTFLQPASNCIMFVGSGRTIPSRESYPPDGSTRMARVLLRLSPTSQVSSIFFNSFYLGAHFCCVNFRFVRFGTRRRLDIQKQTWSRSCCEFLVGLLAPYFALLTLYLLTRPSSLFPLRERTLRTTLVLVNCFIYTVISLMDSSLIPHRGCSVTWFPLTFAFATDCLYTILY